MPFRIEISTPAFQDAANYCSYIRDEKHSPTAAIRWYNGLIEQIHSLSEFPKKYPLIPEEHKHGVEIRQFLYHSHRVIFAVWDQEGVVVVLRIYHGARSPLPSDELV